MVDIIQQTRLTISNFIFIFQQRQIQYKHLDLNSMSAKMSENYKRMKSQALEDYKKLMNDLDCDETEPNEDLIFVKAGFQIGTSNSACDWLMLFRCYFY